jgi:CRP/FNR family transcriptional regulator, cyclic AMP receptor protein
VVTALQGERRWRWLHVDGLPYGVRLLHVEPELADGLSPVELAKARDALVVPGMHIAAGPWESPSAAAGQIGALLLSGMVIRTSTVFARPSVQAFGAGDVIDARLLTDATSEWRALEAGQVAVLGERFQSAAARWPALIDGLARRLLEANQRQHALAAITAMPRVEQRLLALLCHLAERWGRVTPAGVTVKLPVSHTVLGHLVGARRPTVSLALAALTEQRLLRRLPDGTWLLPADCRQWPITGIPAGRPAVTSP